jgi:hypothetical protein
MFQHPSRSEALVLDALQGRDSISLEQITERVPELNWNDLFQAVEAISFCVEKGSRITLRSHA